MIIGIDGNEANVSRRVGVGQFAFHILQNLHRLDHHNRYIVYLKDKPLPDLPPPSASWQYQHFGPQKLWTKFALPLHLYLSSQRPKIFFSPSHYSPHFSPVPTIPTIHDLGYLRFPQQFTSKDLYQLSNWTRRSLAKAKHIVCVSNFTRTEIEKVYSINRHNITVIPNGVEPSPPHFLSPNDAKILSKFAINQPYFLYLGTLKPSKNIPFLIRSFSLFSQTNPKFQLVIAGKKGWLFDDIFATVKSARIENKVIFTDFITEEEKWSLYRQAFASVIPSLYEGFGIPALESMRADTPVICSRIPALAEVVGSNGVFFNPQKPPSLVAAFQKIISPKTRASQITHGRQRSKIFSWENSAKKLVNLFQSYS